MLSDEEIDQLLSELARQGFELPRMARSSGYANVADLQAADREATEANRAALRAALGEVAP